jgi:hypothetical protein
MAEQHADHNGTVQGSSVASMPLFWNFDDYFGCRLDVMLASGIKAAVTVFAIVILTAVASFYALQDRYDTAKLADECDSDDSDAILSD